MRSKRHMVIHEWGVRTEKARTAIVYVLTVMQIQNLEPSRINLSFPAAMTTNDKRGRRRCVEGGTSVLQHQGGQNVCHRDNGGRGVKGGGGGGGGGTVIWATTTKATEDGIGRWAAGAPPSSALPPWRWDMHHLGTPAGDCRQGRECCPMRDNGNKGQQGTAAGAI